MRLLVVVALLGCGSASRLTTVPVGLTLEGEAAAPTARLSLDQAVARRAELRADDPPPGMQAGERAWFFRAFSDDELVFLEGRYAPYDDDRPVKRAGRYRIERRVIVARSARALDALGVRPEVAQREQGICGIRVGMTSSGVRERLGEPSSVMYPAAAGCISEQYGQLWIDSCHGAVTHVRGERCP